MVDISGQRLPGVSRWTGAASLNLHPQLALFGAPGRVQAGIDLYARTGFSSSPTPSRFLNVAGYVLANAQLGWQSESGFSVSLWLRNAFNRNYFDFLSAAPGGSGLVVGQPGDPRTFGVTLGKRF